MATMTEAPITGERIEELQSIAGEHLFMHAQQIEDWRGNLKIYVKGRGRLGGRHRGKSSARCDGRALV